MTQIVVVKVSPLTPKGTTPFLAIVPEVGLLKGFARAGVRIVEGLVLPWSSVTDSKDSEDFWLWVPESP